MVHSLMVTLSGSIATIKSLKKHTHKVIHGATGLKKERLTTLKCPTVIYSVKLLNLGLDKSAKKSSGYSSVS